MRAGTLDKQGMRHRTVVTWGMVLRLSWLALLLAASPAVESATEGLRLCGKARLTWGWMIHIYDAQFWMDATHQGDPLADVAKRYEVVYLRDFSAADCVAATEATFARGLDPDVSARARSGLAAINALYVPVRRGDRFVYDYRPGRGTQLEHNGRVLGVVPGADPAAGLFAIWVGPQPADEDLRRDLLGQH